MGPADWAWVGIGVSVLAYEALAARRNYDLLSEAVDRYRAAHPFIATGVVAYLAAHLTRLIPRALDPLHIAGTKLRPR